MIQHTINIPRSAPWLSPSLLENKNEIRHRFTISEPAKRIFRKHKKMPVSRWAELHRYVAASNIPGRWRNETTPYMAGIIDASFFPSVQTIIICKPPQWGGTEGVLTCVGYAIDRDPGPVLMVYPDELTGRENNQDRIQPMINASPRLKSYLTGAVDDVGLLRVNLSHMPIYIGWATSAARLANKPIRYVVLDEIDKRGYDTGKAETDPISLAEKRTITYRYNRKIWKFSTPTVETGRIWTALITEAQVIFDYHVTCPHCGHHAKMEDRQLEWAHETEPGPDGRCHSLPAETIEAEKLAWYKCPGCAALWNDYDRDRAVSAGKWRDRKDGIELFEYLRIKKPLKIGFHSSALISPFVGLAVFAAAKLRAKTNIDKKKDYYNNYLAEPWKIFIVTKDESQILAARSDVAPQTVPESAIALTCGVDVQLHGFWFVVRAWSAMLTSWAIHYGFLATWEDLERLLFETVYTQAVTGRPFRIFRALVDTGGGKKYENMTMTAETYYWLAKNMGRGGLALWGAKGSNSALPYMLAVGQPILSTPDGKKLTRALRLIMIDTDKAKDQYHFRLDLAANPETRDLPGAAFLHRDAGSDYAAQILAEEKQLIDGKEQWVNVHSRPNHLLDADIYAAACVEMEFPGGGLQLIAEAAKQREQAKPETKKIAVVRSSWMTKK